VAFEKTILQSPKCYFALPEHPAAASLVISDAEI